MTDHHPECEDVTGAYPGSCTCAAIRRKKAMDDLLARDADLIALEARGLEIRSRGAWKEAGQPWLWTYDAHLKGKPNGD